MNSFYPITWISGILEKIGIEAPVDLFVGLLIGGIVSFIISHFQNKSNTRKLEENFREILEEKGANADTFQKILENYNVRNTNKPADNEKKYHDKYLLKTQLEALKEQLDQRYEKEKKLFGEVTNATITEKARIQHEIDKL